MTETSVVQAAPPQRTCAIEQVFDSNFIDLLRLVPKNPSVRALILKLTGKMPVAGCQTFEEIKEWIETTCEKRTLSRRVVGGGISIRVEFAESEYGGAEYSVRRHGASNFQLGANELMDIVERAVNDGEGIDYIVETLAQRIDEDAWGQCEPDMDDYGDYEYSDHESRDVRDGDIEFSWNEIKERVLAFLRAHHPELAAEL